MSSAEEIVEIEDIEVIEPFEKIETEIVFSNKPEAITNSTPQEIELKAIEAIKEIFDPEIPVNIYELGLIYDITVTAAKEVVILMTLTAPNCPEAEGIPVEVENKIKGIPEVTGAKVLLTFDPPWEMSRMTEAAKLELGLL